MDEPAEPGTRAHGLNQLLPTKIHIPSAGQSLVPRPRLLELLDQGLRRKLTLVSAPAGFGKTTLLTEWIHTLARQDTSVAWISLDEGDNDPVRFATYLCAALEGMQAGVAQRALALLQSAQPPALETVITMLINDVAAIRKHFALILDDYHVISASSIHRAVAFLLDHLPEQMHLILASRIDPPLPLSRLRVRRQMIEIRIADLRFTPEEAAAFLQEIMGLELSAEDIATLDARTEGWAAGLQLAALSLQNRNPTAVASFLAAFAGSHRFVLDYLAEEVLQRQDEHTRTFLLQTYILDRLSGPLCNAVTGGSDGQEMLEQLEQRNLFLIPLDDERQWYRYHHLFAEFLRSRLQAAGAQDRPGETPEVLHSRASHWYEDNHFMYEAIEHALAARDFDRAAQLVEAFQASASRRGELVTLLRWFAALPDAIIRKRPQLSLHYAQILLLSGQVADSYERLQDVEQSLAEPDGPHAARREIIQGEILTVRAMTAALHADVAQIRGLAGEALRLLPADHLLRGMGVLSLGSAAWLDGDLAAADRILGEAREVARKTGNLYIFYVATAYLAQVRLGQGALREGVQLYREAIQIVSEQGSAQEGNGLYVGLGALLYERNELDEANRLIQHGLALARQEENALVLIGGQIRLARLREARGLEQEAANRIPEAVALARQHSIGWTWVTGPVFATQVRLWLAQGDLPAATQWAAGLENPPESGTGYFSAPYLQEAEQIMRARVYRAQGRPDAALGILNPLHTAAEAAGRRQHLLEILLLEALIYQQQGNRPAAFSALTIAVEFAERGGFIRTVVDEGLEMATLPRQLRATGDTETAYIDDLLTAYGSVAEPVASGAPSDQPRRPAQPLIDPLSERELEVLQRMASGASNREIADDLVIAVNTVKRHARNIFDKLDAGNRTQAVARARELGLL